MTQLITPALHDLLTTHASTYASVLMSITMLAGCLREAPASSCVQEDDCYFGERCIEGGCVAGDVGAVQDMTTTDSSGDAQKDQDTSRDLEMLIQEDMPSNLSFKEGIIVPDAILPGTRASLLREGMSAPAFLAYFEQENNGTLRLYYPDKASKTWRFTAIASQLDWEGDSREHAALFLEGSALYVFHETRDASANARTLHRVSISPDWMVSSSEVVATLSSVARLGFDYTEAGSPNALLVFPSGAQRYTRATNGSWTLAHTYVEAFESARFVIDSTYICGLVASSSTLKCYNGTDNSPEFEEDRTTSFEVLSDHEHLVLSRDGSLRHAQIEDKRGGNGGLQWKGKVDILNIPEGDRIAIARDARVFTYRQASGSVVWGRDVSTKDLATMALQGNNTMASPSAGQMQLHVVSSPDAGSPNPSIFYQVIAQVP